MRRRIGASSRSEWVVTLMLVAAGCGEQPAPPTAEITPRSASPEITQRPPQPGVSAGAAEVIAPAAAATASAPQLAAIPAELSPPPAAIPTSTPVATVEATAVPASTSDTLEIPFAEAGTLESRLYEITQLVVPPPTQREVPGPDGFRQLVDRTPAEIAADRKAALQKVVKLAGEIIAATHADAARAGLFNNAVHYLCAAHVELALMGEAKSARQLSETADAIFAAKPDSPAAVESAARLLELAQRMGEQFGASDAEWVRAHAMQARLFATRFPLETSRCVTALLDAGRACERVALHPEARLCYQMLADKFGDTPFAAAVAAILRRMSLPGSTLTADAFAGSTIEGDYLTIEQYRGRHVLIVFWNTASPTFQQDFVRLQELQQQHGDKLAIIGVNLDTDELAVDRFLEAHPLKWRQLFDSDPARRGTLNTIAAYYGVATVPMYWLIDPQGRVLAAPADVAQLPL